jgi:hypothetical protein
MEKLQEQEVRRDSRYGYDEPYLEALLRKAEHKVVQAQAKLDANLRPCEQPTQHERISRAKNRLRNVRTAVNMANLAVRDAIAAANGTVEVEPNASANTSDSRALVAAGESDGGAVAGLPVDLQLVHLQVLERMRSKGLVQRRERLLRVLTHEAPDRMQQIRSAVHSEQQVAPDASVMLSKVSQAWSHSHLFRSKCKLTNVMFALGERGDPFAHEQAYEQQQHHKMGDQSGATGLGGSNGSGGGSGGGSLSSSSSSSLDVVVPEVTADALLPMLAPQQQHELRDVLHHRLLQDLVARRRHKHLHELDDSAINESRRRWRRLQRRRYRRQRVMRSVYVHGAGERRPSAEGGGQDLLDEEILEELVVEEKHAEMQRRLSVEHDAHLQYRIEKREAEKQARVAKQRDLMAEDAAKRALKASEGEGEREIELRANTKSRRLQREKSFKMLKNASGKQALQAIDKNKQQQQQKEEEEDAKKNAKVLKSVLSSEGAGGGKVGFKGKKKGTQILNDADSKKSEKLIGHHLQKQKDAGGHACVWVESYDPGQHKFYYHNSLTGETSWHKPENYSMAADDEVGGRHHLSVRGDATVVQLVSPYL